MSKPVCGRDIYAPWPEENDRRVTTLATRFHFTPTERSRQNLLDAHVDSSHIHLTGNTLIETVARLKASPETRAALDRKFSFLDSNQRLVLVTGHRRENLGAGFESICRALIAIVTQNDVQIVYPVHPIPRFAVPSNACSAITRAFI